jgi:hypothetical protein
MAFKKPTFGVNTATMSSELPLLPGGQAWAAVIISAGISEKAPLSLQLEQEWNKDTKQFDKIDNLVISSPYGFGYGVQLLSKRAQAILGRDEPKFFADGIRLVFEDYQVDSKGEPLDSCYNWVASSGTALKEILNAVGLGEEDYSTVVQQQDFIEDLEELYSILACTPEQKELYSKFPEEQVILGLNAVLYWRDFFSVIGKDLENRQVMVNIEKKANKKNKAVQENKIYAGTSFAPSSGITAYIPGSEEDTE